MMAAVMPDILCDQIQKVQETWNIYAGKVTVDKLLECVPVVYPRCNAIPGCNIQGLGKFDLEKWKNEEMPVMDSVGWFQLASPLPPRTPRPWQIFSSSVDASWARSRGSEIRQCQLCSPVSGYASLVQSDLWGIARQFRSLASVILDS